MDPSYNPRTSVELYDENSESWEFYQKLPMDEGFRFPESPDYGCITVKNNLIYSVGLTKILSLDWNTWQVDQVMWPSCLQNQFIPWIKGYFMD